MSPRLGRSRGGGTQADANLEAVKRDVSTGDVFCANGKGSYVMSAPPEEVEKFGSAGRWQLGDELTFGFYHWAKAQKNLRAILAGHLHFDFSERFSPTAVQHVVGANCNGCAAEIEFA